MGVRAKPGGQSWPELYRQECAAPQCGGAALILAVRTQVLSVRQAAPSGLRFARCRITRTYKGRAVECRG